MTLPVRTPALSAAKRPPGFVIEVIDSAEPTFTVEAKGATIV